MPTSSAATKAANAPARFSVVSRTLPDDNPKLDTEAIMAAHKPKSGILQKVKNATGPFAETLTKDMCLDLLSINIDHNRTLNWKKINRYVGQMKSGEFIQYNGDTVRLAYFPKTNEDKLFDSQNRLWAAVIADVPLTVVIVAKIDERAIPTVDTGEMRTAAHMATINGFGAHANQLAYCIKNILYYKKSGKIKGNVSSNDIPNFEVDNFMHNKVETARLDKEIGYAKLYWMRANNKFFTAPQWVTAFYLLRTLPGMEDMARTFMDRFADGVDLRPTSPIKKARSHFETEFKYLTQGKERNKVDRKWLTIKFNVLFTAWNHYVNKETVNDIKINLDQVEIVKPIFRKL